MPPSPPPAPAPARHLTPDEIALLTRRDGRATDWSRVTVAADFTPGDSFYNVRFAGDVYLGRDCEIEDSTLRNVTVGDDCRIRRSDVSDADIGPAAYLDGVFCLSHNGTSTFANGLPVHVLAEDGARSVPLWRGLSAQTAHILCHLRDTAAARRLEELIRRDVSQITTTRSVVSAGCRLRGCGDLVNVYLGEGAVVTGVERLTDCYVDSTPEAPAILGPGVAAAECIFQRGSKVTGGVRLHRCLAGEGARLADGFCAHHSLFFANSDFALGEAACAIAGPFATSGHKASLVLACQTSFATFGSGSNSSNHHFKLGPRHGGVLRRGVRCGSGSYLFWPSDVGTFTTVIGRHAGHVDTAAFPFSLLLAEAGRSVLVPGVNLFTAGMERDAIKWRERDRRTGIERPRDIVNPVALSPYTLEAAAAGAEILRQAAGAGGDVRHGGALIPAARIAPALKLYDAAETFYVGREIFRCAQALCAGAAPGPDDVARGLREAAAEGEPAEAPPDSDPPRWRDWGGMLLPGAEARDVLSRLAAGSFPDCEALRRRLEEIHADYGAFTLRWAAARWRERWGAAAPENIARFAAEWRAAVAFRHECFAKDAAKEFGPDAQIGFGVEEDAAVSFLRLRGDLAEHPLARKMEAERECLLGLTSKL